MSWASPTLRVEVDRAGPGWVALSHASSTCPGWKGVATEAGGAVLW